MTPERPLLTCHIFSWTRCVSIRTGFRLAVQVRLVLLPNQYDQFELDLRWWDVFMTTQEDQRLQNSPGFIGRFDFPLSIYPGAHQDLLYFVVSIHHNSGLYLKITLSSHITVDNPFSSVSKRPMNCESGYNAASGPDITGARREQIRNDQLYTHRECDWWDERKNEKYLRRAGQSGEELHRKDWRCLTDERKHDVIAWSVEYHHLVTPRAHWETLRLFCGFTRSSSHRDHRKPGWKAQHARPYVELRDLSLPGTATKTSCSLARRARTFAKFHTSIISDGDTSFGEDIAFQGDLDRMPGRSSAVSYGGGGHRWSGSKNMGRGIEILV